jgi:hypothetical protein
MSGINQKGGKVRTIPNICSPMDPWLMSTIDAVGVAGHWPLKALPALF